MAVDNLCNFTTCLELRRDREEDQLSFSKYEVCINYLHVEFNQRFQNFSAYEDQFNFFVSPFAFDVADVCIQMELLELQADQ